MPLDLQILAYRQVLMLVLYTLLVLITEAKVLFISHVQILRSCKKMINCGQYLIVLGDR